MNLNKCFYCEYTFGSPVTKKSVPLKRTRDHIIPVARDGNGTSKNLVWACHQCNHLKGSRLPEEFSQFLEWKITASKIGIKSTQCFTRERLMLVLANNDKLIAEIESYRDELIWKIPKEKPPTLKEICNRVKLSKKEKEVIKATEKAPFFDNPIKLQSFIEKYNSEPEPNFSYQ